MWVCDRCTSLRDLFKVLAHFCGILTREPDRSAIIRCLKESRISVCRWIETGQSSLHDPWMLLLHDIADPTRKAVHTPSFSAQRSTDILPYGIETSMHVYLPTYLSCVTYDIPKYCKLKHQESSRLWQKPAQEPSKQTPNSPKSTPITPSERHQ